MASPSPTTTTTTTSSLTYTRAEGPLADKLRRELQSFYEDFILVSPNNQVLPHLYPTWHQRYVEFPVKKDDVWVATYPKSGTTWMQEVVWCLVRGLEHPDSSLSLMKRFPFFEWDSLIPADLKKEEGQAEDDPCLPGNTWRILANMPSPRTIKCHLHKPLLPRQIDEVKPKVVYVCRDPRDVCISYYYHSIKLDGYTGKLNDFVELFLGDMLPWSPFWEHLLEFWKVRQQENMLFVRFEDMKEDLPGVVRQVAAFLGRPVDDARVKLIADHCSFSSMSTNTAVNNEDIISADTDKGKSIKFMRKGKVGDWKNHLSPEQIKSFKEWTQEKLKGSDFPYYQDYD